MALSIGSLDFAYAAAEAIILVSQTWRQGASDKCGDY